MVATSQQNDKTTAIATLADAQKQGCNVLYPSVQQFEISPLQQVSIEMVKIDPNPDNKEVFKVTKNQFGLTKVALQKLAHTAGIIFDPERSRRTDDGRNPKSLVFSATGALRKPDGSWITMTASKEVDLLVIEKETRARLEEEGMAGKLFDWDPHKQGEKNYYKYGTRECTTKIEREFKSCMLQVEKHKHALAETGAYNRVIRAILAIKPTYTAQELDKLFVVPRVTVNPKFILSDPNLKREFMRSALTTNINDIFGRPQLPTSSNIEQIPTDNSVEEENELVGHLVTETIEKATVASIQEAIVVKSQVTEKEFKESWMQSTPAERLVKIDELIKLKNYSPKEGSIGPSSLSPENQVKYLWFLINLPDPEKKDEPILPFE